MLLTTSSHYQNYFISTRGNTKHHSQTSHSSRRKKTANGCIWSKQSLGYQTSIFCISLQPKALFFLCFSMKSTSCSIKPIHSLWIFRILSIVDKEHTNYPNHFFSIMTLTHCIQHTSKKSARVRSVNFEGVTVLASYQWVFPLKCF